MDRKKVTIFILTIIICSLNVFAYFRWSYAASESVSVSDFVYKTDRWTNKIWVEFYPELGIGAMEFPLVNKHISKFDSYTQLESHVKKYAISGALVSEWIERVTLTYLYYGINLILIVVIIILLLKYRGKKIKPF
jgi:hypothetical protein